MVKTGKIYKSRDFKVVLKIIATFSNIYETELAFVIEIIEDEDLTLKEHLCKIDSNEEPNWSEYYSVPSYLLDQLHLEDLAS